MPLPLDLFAEVTTTSGARYSWDANQPAGSRPRDLSFSTKIGEGFSAGSLSLSRRTDLDYPDLGLVDTVTVTGADGSVAYEGRVAAMPRTLGDSHSIGVQLAGWMAHARDRPMTEIYVDRDLSAWSGMSVRRRRNLLTSGFSGLSDASQSPDPTNNESGVANTISGSWLAGFLPVSEGWYYAGPTNTIGRVYYSWQREGTAIDNTDPNWKWLLGLSTDDVLTAQQNTGDLRAAGPTTNALLTANAATYRYAYMQLYYNAGPGGSDGRTWVLLWKKLAVYGNHGLNLYTGQTSEPPGVLASDVIRNIAGRWCPQLDTSGVQDTNYVIQHMAFKDPVDPYDALLEVNKYHLWHLGVWENKTLHFRPYDLADYDWEVRMDDPGTTIDWQGESTDTVHNGITVTYTDLLTGVKNVLLPSDYPELKDANSDIPWNKAGIDNWDKIDLSSPVLKDDALQLGRMALAERIRPKNPGTITIRGYVRDRSGALQPVWKVRAGDTISITNHPNDRPRLVVETEYNDADKSVRLAIDRPFQLLEALLDRQQNGLNARGL